MAKNIVAFSKEEWKAAFSSGAENDSVQLSAKAEQVKKLIDEEDFGCYTDKVCRLMSILLDEKISLDGEKGSSQEISSIDFKDGFIFYWEGINFVWGGKFLYFDIDEILIFETDLSSNDTVDRLIESKELRPVAQKKVEGFLESLPLKLLLKIEKKFGK